MSRSRAFVLKLGLLAISVSPFAAGCRPTTSTSPTHDAPESAESDRTGPLKSSPPLSGTTLTTRAIHFTSRSAGSGIDFVHVSGDSPEKPFPAANGSGIAAFDYDRDGLCDLYFATGNSLPLTGPGAASNRFYRNQGGWRFRGRSGEAGLGHRGYSAGLAVGDFDADGFPDVYVNCYGRNVLYQNQGDGTFQDVSRASQTDDDKWGTSTTFLDYDADGLLDLYVGNYAQWTPETNPYCGDRQRNRRMFCGPAMVRPEADVLYHNAGDGAFADSSAVSGISVKAGRAQGVLAADLDEDGWTDLYVTNDLNPNLQLMNQKDGTFRDDAELAGTAYDRTGKVLAGMGVTAADARHQGVFDLFVTNFEDVHNVYYRKDAAGFYQDVSHILGLAADSLPWIGWGTSLTDFDLDGWSDLIVVNGHTDNNLSEFGREGEYAQPALVWRNIRGTFEGLGPAAGEYFRSRHPGRGLAVADLDGDGDWDVVCGHQDGPPELLGNDRGEGSQDSSFIRLSLIGRNSNREAVGTTLRITTEQGDVIAQFMGGGSYLSASERAVLIGTAGIRLNAEITVSLRWPGDGEQTFATLPGAGRFVIIEPVRGQQICRTLPESSTLP